MNLHRDFEEKPVEGKVLEENTESNKSILSDEEKVADSTNSGSLDIQAAEREMNRHLNEAGLLYQSLGDSLRKMETIQKKVFLEQQSSISKINMLNSKINEQEQHVVYQKVLVKFLICLSLILGVSTVILIFMLKKETSQNNNFNQNEKNITELIKKFEESQAEKPSFKSNRIAKPKNVTPETEPTNESNFLLPENIDSKDAEPEEVKPQTEINDLSETENIKIEDLDKTKSTKTQEMTSQNDSTEISQKPVVLTEKEIKTKIKNLENNYFKALNDADLIKANQIMLEILSLNPDHYLKGMIKKEPHTTK